MILDKIVPEQSITVAVRLAVLKSGKSWFQSYLMTKIVVLIQSQPINYMLWISLQEITIRETITVAHEKNNTVFLKHFIKTEMQKKNIHYFKDAFNIFPFYVELPQVKKLTNYM